MSGGLSSSASEVVRDLLRLLQPEEQRRKDSLEALPSEVHQGLDNGLGRAPDDVFQMLERKYVCQGSEPIQP